MTLRVVTHGPLVPAGPVNGSVVHASTSAVWVAWADGGPLTAVHADTAGRSPWSVTVDGLGEARTWARPGDPAAVRAGRLRAGRLVVTLAPQARWEPEPARSQEPVTAPFPLRALAPDAFAQAMTRIGGEAALAAPDRLVGLGPGLTPSGDDVLTGALCVLHRRGSRAASSLHRRLAGVARGAAGRTTAVGEHQLSAAAAGWFAAPVCAVVDATEASEAARRLPALLAVGATSGADLWAGVVLAFDALATTGGPVP